MTLKILKLKGVRFAAATIGRYKRCETPVEEVMIEMYLAGVFTRRIEGMPEILWGSNVSVATVLNLNDKAFGAVEAWRSRPLTCDYFYVFVDSICLKRLWGGSFESVAIMVAISVAETLAYTGVSYAALEVHSHQYRHRAPESRNQKNEVHRHVP